MYTHGGILCKAIFAKIRLIMAHTAAIEKKRLLNRVRRIRGQVEALERTLEEESECADTLHAIAVCRGALDSLMAEVIEGHIRFHVLDPSARPPNRRHRPPTI